MLKANGVIATYASDLDPEPVLPLQCIAHAHDQVEAGGSPGTIVLAI
jgi:hypothetical protein